MKGRMTLQQRINWQISELRGWRKVDAGFGCTHLVDPGGTIIETSRHEGRIEAAQIDWHADANWPTLFRELPKGALLVQRMEDGGSPFLLCGCKCEGNIRICEHDEEIGALICRSWLAVTLAKGMIPELTDMKAMLSRPTSHSVN